MKMMLFFDICMLIVYGALMIIVAVLIYGAFYDVETPNKFVCKVIKCSGAVIFIVIFVMIFAMIGECIFEMIFVN